MTDQEILTGLKNGNRPTVDHVFERWKPWIILVLAKDQASVEDSSVVMRQVIYSIMLRLQESPLVLTSNFEAYLTRACRYAWWRMKAKASDGEIMPLDSFSDDEPSIEELMFLQERNRLLWDSIEKLSSKCKEMIQGVYFKGELLQDVGERLGYSRDFTRKKPRRCFNNLLQIWSNDPRYKDYFL